MSVSCECCASPGRGFCDGPITRPEESFRVCVRARVRVSEYDRETSQGWPWPTTAAEP
jgi:hypothetical protein